MGSPLAPMDSANRELTPTLLPSKLRELPVVTPLPPSTLRELPPAPRPGDELPASPSGTSHCVRPAARF